MTFDPSNKPYATASVAMSGVIPASPGNLPISGEFDGVVSSAQWTFEALHNSGVAVIPVEIVVELYDQSGANPGEEITGMVAKIYNDSGADITGEDIQFNVYGIGLGPNSVAHLFNNMVWKAGTAITLTLEHAIA